eukprot:scaffold78883_cov62-Phaeocystis_antarctica.AAC.2
MQTSCSTTCSSASAARTASRASGSLVTSSRKPPPPAPVSVAPCTRGRSLASIRLTASGSASHMRFFCSQ